MNRSMLHLIKWNIISYKSHVILEKKLRRRYIDSDMKKDICVVPNREET